MKVDSSKNKIKKLKALPYGEGLGGVLSVTERLVLSCVEISRSAEKQKTTHFKNHAKS